MQARGCQRMLRLELVFMAALSLAGCAKDGEDSAAAAETRGVEGSASVSTMAEAKAEANARVDVALNIEPKLGGSVLVVGESQVEVAVFENGAVKGLVFDARGNPISDRAALDFAVTLHTVGGGAPKVNLVWDAACACFSGHAAPSAALVVEPIDISLGLAGSVDSAQLGAYALLPAPKLDAEVNAAAAGAALPKPPKVDAKLSSSANGLAELKAPKVDAKASAGSTATTGAKASASASVSVPKPSVHLEVGESTSTKNKAGAGVKGGASFGFGTK